ncbi:helix-turn-helix domain-containing protein [Deinococcus sp. Marseille-Q6407]|uniref:helix-turn-helix domain-containing protein n=1 Tax=Deinococcus sp. Marseille-Q6407 TaxID=2969223 RepID=UPI0021C1E398|nr:helix-turn-helix transcriptional regulator [Deinococcus sp. Marseille-Q6407]
MKTAQEWQQHLGLDELPDDEFVTALNSLEGEEAIAGGGLEAQGLVATQTSPAELVGALVVESAGEAFKAARQEQGLTVRQAAESWGISPGRVSQMESPEANLYMSTVGSAALRMGYRAKLVLEPIDGGQPIEASLSQ